MPVPGFWKSKDIASFWTPAYILKLNVCTCLGLGVEQGGLGVGARARHHVVLLQPARLLPLGGKGGVGFEGVRVRLLAAALWPAASGCVRVHAPLIVHI